MGGGGVLSTADWWRSWFVEMFLLLQLRTEHMPKFQFTLMHNIINFKISWWSTSHIVTKSLLYIIGNLVVLLLGMLMTWLDLRVGEGVATVAFFTPVTENHKTT